MLYPLSYEGMLLNYLEVETGFEPAHNSFADCRV
jgi:hypothetical protein